MGVRDVELVGRGKFGGLAAWIDAWFLSGWFVRRGEYAKQFDDGGRFGLGGAWALVQLLEMALDGGIRGGAVLHCVAEGEAEKGVVVACIDGCKPGGRDWVFSRGMVEMDKSTDAGEVVHAGGLGG